MDMTRVSVIAKPEDILNDYARRFTYFIKRKHNSADELTVLFSKGVLYFSDEITQKEAEKYKKIFFDFGQSRSITGKRQDKRYSDIKERFGKQGEDTAIEMFIYYKS